MKLTKKQLKEFDHLSDEEIEKDKYESTQDIIACELALMQGITEYSGGDVKVRQQKNREFISTIEQVQAYRIERLSKPEDE